MGNGRTMFKEWNVDLFEVRCGRAGLGDDWMECEAKPILSARLPDSETSPVSPQAAIVMPVSLIIDR